MLLADEEPEALRRLPVTCVSPRRTGTRAPFLVYFGEAPAYACLRERDGDERRFFHTSDRVLVEHLAFQLQRELGRRCRRMSDDGPTLIGVVLIADGDLDRGKAIAEACAVRGPRDALRRPRRRGARGRARRAARRAGGGPRAAR